MLPTEYLVSLALGVGLIATVTARSIYSTSYKPYRDIEVYDWQDKTENQLRREYVYESLQSVHWVRTMALTGFGGVILGTGLYLVHRLLLAV